MSAPAQRYAAVAIVLHWAIAIAILLMVPFGWWMGDEVEDGVVSDGLFQAYQFHKSVGLTVLALSLVRLGWRLANPPPPLPDHMPAWEQWVARLTHWGFYVLMIGLPLSGWIYVSAGWSVHDDQPVSVATHYFGLFRMPDLFGLPQASEAVRAAVAGASMQAHSLLAWGALILAALHAGAALKHHFFDRDAVLAQMVPGLRAPFQSEPAPKNPVRLAILGGGLGLTAVALVSALFSVSAMMADGAPPAPSSVAITEAAPESAPMGPNAWRVDQDASSIGFVFSYRDQAGAETQFTGRFTNWRADIVFDPEALDQSAVAVTIETASATDGVVLHDRTLPSEPWFNAAAYPNATFRTTEIVHLGADAYRARGELTIKDRTREVELPFTLSIEGRRAVMNGRTSIDRQDFDIGEGTDADDAISREIDVVIRVEATRAP